MRMDDEALSLYDYELILSRNANGTQVRVHARVFSSCIEPAFLKPTHAAESSLESIDITMCIRACCLVKLTHREKAPHSASLPQSYSWVHVAEC